MSIADQIRKFRLQPVPPKATARILMSPDTLLDLVDEVGTGAFGPDLLFEGFHIKIEHEMFNRDVHLEITQVVTK